MKHKLGILLTSFLMASSMTALADDTWTISPDGALKINSGVTLSGEVTVPETVDGISVTSLANGAFNNQTGVTSIVLPDTIQRMSSGALNFLDGVTSLKLSENMTVIGDMNGSLKGLTELTIPASVRYIGDSFTSLQSLQTLTFEGVCPVFDSDDPLYGMNNNAVIYVPDDQVDAYKAALAGGYDIDALVQPSGKEAVIYSNPAPETDFVFDAATGTITGYNGAAAYLEIPAAIGGSPVLAIGEKAFTGNTLLSYVVIPEGIERIEAEAFYGCSGLTAVDFSSTLKAIGDSAFAGCSLVKIGWAEGLEEIGANAFEGLVVRSLTLPFTVKTIGEAAFKNGTIQQLCIGNAIESIGAEAFANNSIDYIDLMTEQMIQVDETAFEGNTYDTEIYLHWNMNYHIFEEYETLFSHIYPGYTYVYIMDPIDDPFMHLEYPADGTDSYNQDVWVSYNGTQPDLMTWYSWNGLPISTLGDGIFKGNQTIRSWYPSHFFAFDHIGSEAFADSSVEIVDLFYGIETIGDAAFRNCVNIKEITLPETLTEIAANALEGCTGLEKITILCDPSVIPEGLLDSCTAVKEISVGPDATEEEKLQMTFALYGMPEVTITQQPSDVTVAEGETASVSLQAEGENLTYAWYSGMDGNYQLSEAFTGTTYEIQMSKECSGQQAYCVVSDTYGTSATSEVVTLRMITPLQLTEQPADATAVAGEKAELHVLAEGDGLSYQWYINNAPADGAVSENFSVEMTSEYDGVQVHCIVTDAYGNSIASEKAVLKLPAELAITTQPTGAELPEGEMTEIFVEATGDGLTYQWYVMPGDSNEYVAAEGFTTNVYSVVVDENSDWSSVYCEITDAYGNTVTSESASIFIAEAEIEMPEGTVDASMAGHWVAVRAEAEGIVIEEEQLAEYGMNILLDLYDDGSAVLFEEEEVDGIQWIVAEDTLYLNYDGDVLPFMIEADGTLNYEGIVLEKQGDAPAAVVKEVKASEAVSETGSDTASAVSADPEDRMNRKFVAKTYIAMGQMMDASVLNAEYSLLFREDGTCDFCLGGTVLPNLPWKMDTVEIDGAEADAYVINYYGTMFHAVLTETGFDMDYYGTMILNFTPAE